jgi:hypothetical protein
MSLSWTVVSWPCPCLPLPGHDLLERDRGWRLTHQPSAPTDKHTIRFIPHENGVHSIDVKFNGAHIPGSPFKIRVGEQSQAGDPGLVSAYGPGLEGGTTGECLELRSRWILGCLDTHGYCLVLEAGVVLTKSPSSCRAAQGLSSALGHISSFLSLAPPGPQVCHQSSS